MECFLAILQFPSRAKHTAFHDLQGFSPISLQRKPFLLPSKLLTVTLPLPFPLRYGGGGSNNVEILNLSVR
jgi:hypothetical protein